MLGFIWPLLAGGGMLWMSGKSKGRNAKSFFQYSAWGFWLLYLRFLAPILFSPLLWPLAWLLLLIPSGLCFAVALNFIVKEMRAQQRGEYTDAV